MAALPPASLNVDRYVVIHVATTCDEHGVYVTKDSAEVIEIGWIMVDAKTLEEVGAPDPTRLTAPTTGHAPHAPSRAAQKLTPALCLIATPREHSGQACKHTDNSSMQYVLLHCMLLARSFAINSQPLPTFGLANTCLGPQS